MIFHSSLACCTLNPQGMTKLCLHLCLNLYHHTSLLGICKCTAMKFATSAVPQVSIRSHWRACFLLDVAGLGSCGSEYYLCSRTPCRSLVSTLDTQQWCHAVSIVQFCPYKRPTRPCTSSTFLTFFIQGGNTFEFHCQRHHDSFRSKLCLKPALFDAFFTQPKLKGKLPRTSVTWHSI